MAKINSLSVKDLQLDLRNFRTVPQKDEESALYTMVSIAPDRFWALCESLLDSGYLPTENIIVLKTKSGELIVKEGNRRIGTLKLILGYLKFGSLNVPNETLKRIKAVNGTWKKSNEIVPCAIYEHTEEALVDKIVTLAHGKGEKAGRDNWTSVARARHSRDKNGVSEIGLDLLEKYLVDGRNLTTVERELWSGVYPLAVLDETMGRIAPRIGLVSSRELANRYPSIAHREKIEQILKDIGEERVTFVKIRDRNSDFATAYGIPLASPPPVGGSKGGILTGTPTGRKGVKAVSANDPRSVMRALKSFAPRGKGRDKVVTLLNEIRLLKIEKHPHAFCFLLRAMFELSAKAYCADYAAAGLSMLKKDGSSKDLANALTDITKHMMGGKKPTDPLCKSLHGAMTELRKKDGLLSVTSMNQLIHNPNFIVDDSHICTVFFNVFPLLVEMNR